MMRKFLQNKLWRDKCPGKMESSGSIVHLKNLSDDEYDQQLRIKLLEEANEVNTALVLQDLINELADVLEVVDALCLLHGISKNDVEIFKQAKRNNLGGFEGRKFVVVAEHPRGGFGESYCLEQPEKYPEIE